MMDATTDQQDTPTPTPRAKSSWFRTAFAAVTVLVLAVAVVLVIQNKNQSVNAAPVATVQITSNDFSPNTVRIKKGQSVTWINADSASHQVASDPYPSADILPALLSGSLNQGDSYTFTFENAGVFTYHDQVNPVALHGTVVVE